MGKTHSTCYVLRTLVAVRVLQAFKCSLMRLMNYEEGSSVGFFSVTRIIRSQ